MELFCEILSVVASALVNIVDLIFGDQLASEVSSLLYNDILLDVFGCILG